MTTTRLEMERSMTKTLTFGIMHMSVAFGVVYLMTGDALTGGLVALVEPCINTVGYHIHEKIWALRGESVASMPRGGYCGHALG